MARTGPQFYPGASRAYWYEDNYPGDPFEANVGVLHTTEGTSLPSYGGGASAPNFTAVPDFERKKLRWYQHFRVDTSSRALMNLRGGVETNTLNALQVELVGTCDPAAHRRWSRQHIFWPEAPDWALVELARFVRWCSDEHRIPMRSTVRWLSYPSSYGSTSARLSGGQWQDYYGWLGHQHVPENNHGDPGSLNMARVLTFAKNKSWEDDVTRDDIEAIADRVVEVIAKRDGVFDVGEKMRRSNPSNEEWQLESILAFIGDRLVEIKDKLGA